MKTQVGKLGLVQQRKSFLAMAFRPWRILARLMADRQTYKDLSRMEDYMLKDIGLSRGSILSAIREGRIRN
jgi:uncharacterized protein YjiS (DUF1127 family)